MGLCEGAGVGELETLAAGGDVVLPPPHPANAMVAEIGNKKATFPTCLISYLLGFQHSKMALRLNAVHDGELMIF